MESKFFKQVQTEVLKERKFPLKSRERERLTSIDIMVNLKNRMNQPFVAFGPSIQRSLTDTFTDHQLISVSHFTSFYQLDVPVANNNTVCNVLGEIVILEHEPTFHFVSSVSTLSSCVVKILSLIQIIIAVPSVTCSYFNVIRINVV